MKRTVRNIFFVFVVLSLFMVTPAFPQGPAGCRSGSFVGSYTSLATITDLCDGSNVLQQTVVQLTLHSDGTARQEATGFPVLMLSFGMASSQVGSWTCRSDGKLVVTLLFAFLVPTTDAINHPSTVPNPPPVDLLIFRHTRITFLISVTDANTLTITQTRRRHYLPTQDPTDPNGGFLGPLETDQVVYKRVVASDADLLAP